MSKFFSFTFLFLTTLGAAQAGHLDKVCEGSRENGRFGEVVFTSEFLSRPMERGSVIETHEGEVIFESEVPLRGLLRAGESLWALGQFDLFELNLSGRLLNTYNFEPSGNPVWQAQSFALAGDTMVITRGWAGLMGFDLKSRSVQWTNALGAQDGVPGGVVFNGERVYVTVATSVEAGFTGVMTVNPETGEVTGRTPYNQARAGVIAPDATAIWHKDQLIINNSGWLHLLTQTQLASARATRPRWLAHEIPAQGSVNQHYMMFDGGIFVEDDHVVGCGTYTDYIDGTYVRRNRLFRVALR